LARPAWLKVQNANTAPPRLASRSAKAGTSTRKTSAS
jgi:hypothetical protein